MYNNRVALISRLSVHKTSALVSLCSMLYTSLSLSMSGEGGGGDDDVAGGEGPPGDRG